MSNTKPGGVMAPPRTRSDQAAADATWQVSAVVGLLGALDAQLRAWEVRRNLWVCGACGCLCRAGETCPVCRADLATLCGPS